jgi:hypothetical protein
MIPEETFTVPKVVIPVTVRSVVSIFDTSISPALMSTLLNVETPETLN